jgi:hypothetical protein
VGGEEQIAAIWWRTEGKHRSATTGNNAEAFSVNKTEDGGDLFNSSGSDDGGRNNAIDRIVTFTVANMCLTDDPGKAGDDSITKRHKSPECFLMDITEG